MRNTTKSKTVNKLITIEVMEIISGRTHIVHLKKVFHKKKNMYALVATERALGPQQESYPTSNRDKNVFASLRTKNCWFYNCMLL